MKFLKFSSYQFSVYMGKKCAVLVVFIDTVSTFACSECLHGKKCAVLVVFIDTMSTFACSECLHGKKCAVLVVFIDTVSTFACPECLSFIFFSLPNIKERKNGFLATFLFSCRYCSLF